MSAQQEATNQTALELLDKLDRLDLNHLNYTETGQLQDGITTEIQHLEQQVRQKTERVAQYSLRRTSAARQAGMAYVSLGAEADEEEGRLRREIASVQPLLERLREKRRALSLRSQQLHQARLEARENANQQLHDLQRKEKRLSTDLAPDARFDRELNSAAANVEQALRELDGAQLRRTQADKELAELRRRIARFQQDLEEQISQI
jgi:hypothetical protein